MSAVAAHRDAEVRLADLGDLADLELPEPVGVVFSDVVFHWVPDRARLFSRLFDALRAGSRLEAQCGGRGNNVDPPDGRGFLRGSCLPPFLERLPEEVHEQFTDRLVAELGEPLHLDYSG